VAEDVTPCLQRERAPSSVKQFHAELVCPDAWHSCISCARAICLLYTHAQRQRSPGAKQQVESFSSHFGMRNLSLATFLSLSRSLSCSLSRALSLSLFNTHTHTHTHRRHCTCATTQRSVCDSWNNHLCLCFVWRARCSFRITRARSSLCLSLFYTHTHTNTHTQTQTQTQTHNRSAKL